MAFNLSNAIGSLNDALPPNPFKATNNLPSAFGGEATGFAKGVGELYSKNFYGGEGTPADAATVSKGMSGKPLASSIANKYALFNFQGFHGSLTKNSKENYIDLNKEQNNQILDMLTALEELDDVQNIFINANIKNL